jgi:hypothetical protein
MPYDTSRSEPNKNPMRDNQQVRMLKAWQVIELTRPQSFQEFEDFISDSRGKRSLADFDEVLPWSSYKPLTPRSNPLGGGKKSKNYYHVPLGFYYPDNFFDFAENIYHDFEELFPKGSKCLAFSMILNEAGGYLNSKFSPFAGFLSDIVAGQFRAIAEQADAKVESMNDSVDKNIRDVVGDRPLTADDLEQIYKIVRAMVDLPETFLRTSLIAVDSVPIHDSHIPFSIIGESFYLNDIAQAKHLIMSEDAPDSLLAYLDSPSRTADNGDLDFLAKTGDLEWAIRPQHMPAARWPSPPGVHLNLLQQAAINGVVQKFKATDSSRIHSINGPPGTGKTTLLRDLIAHVITERARAISKFEFPEQGFLGVNHQQGFGWISDLHPSLYGHEILVASSNNKAVENISQELPRRDVVDANIDCPYFEKVAQFIYDDENAWGLIAAVFGRRSNRDRFMRRFWEDDNGKVCGMQERLKAAMNTSAGREHQLAKNWNAALKSFKAIDLEVQRLITEEQDKLSGLSIIEEAVSRDNHRQPPFVNKALHEARGQLFAAALHLQQAFILHQAQTIHKNLAAFSQMIRGGGSVSGQQSAALWATFFLVVPLVSTTFASIRTMFRNYPMGQLGWLLIDEAGQAAPQQAVGAIMRSKNVLVVGDPLQLQPIFPLPNDVSGRLFEEFFLEYILSPTSSVQTLADKVSGIYTKAKSEQRIGSPLLVHRRCESPMFEVSNKVAYGNQMIKATPPRSSAIGHTLGPSTWINVMPNASGGRHWNAEEWEALKLKIDILRNERIDPDVYILSPFRAVADQVKRHMREYMKQADAVAWFEDINRNPERWINDRIGTVHTSQGREAEAVFVVMGASNNYGARQWAGGTPNLVNVLVSRAKSCIYVFGAFKEWSHPSNAFSVLAQYLSPDVTKDPGDEGFDLDLFR